MNDNTGEPTSEIFKFYYEFSFKAKGVCETVYEDVETLKAKLVEDFNGIYGEGNYQIDILEPASEEKLKEIHDAVEAMQEVFEAEEEPTIN